MSCVLSTTGEPAFLTSVRTTGVEQALFVGADRRVRPFLKMHTPSHSITPPNPVRTPSLGGRSGPPLLVCREKSGLVVALAELALESDGEWLAVRESD